MPDTRSVQRNLAIFFGCTTAILAAVVVWLIAPRLITNTHQDRPFDQGIVFPTKTFVGSTRWVGAKGTMTADWVGYKNNTYSTKLLGHPKLVDHFKEVLAIMRGARNWAEFYDLLDRSLPRFNETLQLPFYDTQAMERLPQPQWPWNKEAAN